MNKILSVLFLLLVSFGFAQSSTYEGNFYTSNVTARSNDKSGSIENKLYTIDRVEWIKISVALLDDNDDFAGQRIVDVLKIYLLEDESFEQIENPLIYDRFYWTNVYPEFIKEKQQVYIQTRNWNNGYYGHKIIDPKTGKSIIVCSRDEDYCGP